MSTTHVDILQNDWAAGVQRRLLSLCLNGAGRIEVEDSDSPEEMASRFLQPTLDPLTGIEVSPSSPAAFLEAVARSLQTSYFVAVGPHDASNCTLPDSGVVRMQAEPS